MVKTQTGASGMTNKWNLMWKHSDDIAPFIVEDGTYNEMRSSLKAHYDALDKREWGQQVSTRNDRTFKGVAYFELSGEYLYGLSYWIEKAI
jgi:hypothetical protein